MMNDAAWHGSNKRKPITGSAESVDMEKPCMPEAGLLDEPLQAMQDPRLRQLLADWPENPILTQLLVLCQRLTGEPLCLPSRALLCSPRKSIRRATHERELQNKWTHPSSLLTHQQCRGNPAIRFLQHDCKWIVQRCPLRWSCPGSQPPRCPDVCWLAGMAAQSPLAEVMTGLELLLARSQLWQESAAQHVSIARQLERLAALALRWRRMQLHAWRSTIHKLKAHHAAGDTTDPAPAMSCRVVASSA